ncbi:NADH dehydrogenase [ubiquinone] 1 beta subcomplex subunit 10-like [Watersipora subatra]|uniref:NADH dehydrogenase [ubiquinone] 1 beta subcomplex subunit 10-like n=1 Tax=Watersipora subatra TaxID=2589382 RepID=UPI00355B156C
MPSQEPWFHRWSENLANAFIASMQWPGDKLRDLTAPFREKNKTVYYHRKLKRVTPIEDCHEDDALCIYEAERQFTRDRMVDETILGILRQRMMECTYYYRQDSAFKCKKETQDLEVSEANYFAKYGDLGTRLQDPVDAFRKQQHRMIWERRHQKSMIDGKPLPITESSDDS